MKSFLAGLLACYFFMSFYEKNCAKKQEKYILHGIFLSEVLDIFSYEIHMVNVVTPL